MIGFQLLGVWGMKQGCVGSQVDKRGECMGVEGEDKDLYQ